MRLELVGKAMNQPHGRLRSLSFFDLTRASQLALISPEQSNRIRAVGGMTARGETMSDSLIEYSTRIGSPLEEQM